MTYTNHILKIARINNLLSRIQRKFLLQKEKHVRITIEHPLATTTRAHRKGILEQAIHKIVLHFRDQQSTPNKLSLSSQDKQYQMLDLLFPDLILINVVDPNSFVSYSHCR